MVNIVQNKCRIVNYKVLGYNQTMTVATQPSFELAKLLSELPPKYSAVFRPSRRGDGVMISVKYRPELGEKALSKNREIDDSISASKRADEGFSIMFKEAFDELRKEVASLGL